MMNYISSLSHIVGLIGVVLLLAAFFLLNTNKLSSDDLSYQWSNFFGSGFILFSLIFKWNLPAASIEIAWMVISIIGIVRIYKGMAVKGKSSS